MVLLVVVLPVVVLVVVLLRLLLCCCCCWVAWGTGGLGATGWELSLWIAAVLEVIHDGCWPPRKVLAVAMDDAICLSTAAAGRGFPPGLG